jgi:hypothetical protein
LLRLPFVLLAYAFIRSIVFQNKKGSVVWWIRSAAEFPTIAVSIIANDVHISSCAPRKSSNLLRLLAEERSYEIRFASMRN